MVRLQYLDTFKTFRTTPPVIMPEIKGDRKKRFVYMVWAPTIEQEFIYLTTNAYIRYNNIHRYFIPKRWQGTVYGKGNQILQFNKNGEISELLEKYKFAPNLKNIANVVSYLPSNTARPMKGYNVLVEQNYLFETFLNNEKDRRIPSNKFKDALNALIKDFQNGDISINPYLLDLKFSGNGYANVPLRNILMKERKAIRDAGNERGFAIIKKEVMKKYVGHSPDFIEAMLYREYFNIKPRNLKPKFTMRYVSRTVR